MSQENFEICKKTPLALNECLVIFAMHLGLEGDQFASTNFITNLFWLGAERAAVVSSCNKTRVFGWSGANKCRNRFGDHIIISSWEFTVDAIICIATLLEN